MPDTIMTWQSIAPAIPEIYLVAAICALLLALSVYAMAAFDRDSGVAAESAMKYFVLGAIGSGALLYGMSMIYGMTGSLDLEEIASRLHEPPNLGVTIGLV